MSRKRMLLTIGIAATVLSLSLVPAIAAAKGFVHGIVIEVDGEDYYLAGAPDGPDGATDVPGHDWMQAGKDKLVGRHYNTGPFGAPQWWSSDAPDGELLYIVKGMIDTWTAEKAEQYASRGYVHYHELVAVDDGEEHPTKVVWLKHTARTSFTLDGGPGAPNPPYEHEVTPGVDYEFPTWRALTMAGALRHLSPATTECRRSRVIVWPSRTST
jgi:selenium-binding protein 1